MHQRLWARVAVSFLLFLIAGTVGLFLLLNFAFQRHSRGEFATLAASNATFMQSLNLPASTQMADYLTQMLGVEVRFNDTRVPDDRHESVTVPVRAGVEMTMIRERPTLWTLFMRPTALGVLAVFWGLWFALVWAVVRPILKAQRLAVLGQMATGLAHEIQNPVAAIRLHSQLLERTEPGAAALIQGEAATIERLVNQWMFVARPDAPSRSVFRLTELVEQSVRVLTPAAEHARVRITVVGSREAEVSGDARRLGQVVHNVMLNAIQAMSTGGTLTITVRDGGMSFADTGPGFSRTALLRWGEMMYSEKEGGMGLGLCMAKEVVRAHGGRLRVANRAEGGALVEVDL